MILSLAEVCEWKQIFVNEPTPKDDKFKIGISFVILGKKNYRISGFNGFLPLEWAWIGSGFAKIFGGNEKKMYFSDFLSFFNLISWPCVIFVPTKIGYGMELNSPIIFASSGLSGHLLWIGLSILESGDTWIAQIPGFKVKFVLVLGRPGQRAGAIKNSDPTR